ncbi:MAG TPA: hypothetical protein VKT33_03725 [Candidatus Angelobacter sp.]|nr:hypothetical protein [Candidatus Angelobacter sp.]
MKSRAASAVPQGGTEEITFSLPAVETAGYSQPSRIRGTGVWKRKQSDLSMNSGVADISDVLLNLCKEALNSTLANILLYDPIVSD